MKMSVSKLLKINSNYISKFKAYSHIVKVSQFTFAKRTKTKKKDETPQAKKAKKEEDEYEMLREKIKERDNEEEFDESIRKGEIEHEQKPNLKKESMGSRFMSFFSKKKVEDEGEFLTNDAILEEQAKAGDMMKSMAMDLKMEFSEEETEKIQERKEETIEAREEDEAYQHFLQYLRISNYRERIKNHLKDKNFAKDVLPFLDKLQKDYHLNKHYLSIIYLN